MTANETQDLMWMGSPKTKQLLNLLCIEYIMVLLTWANSQA